jgi:hypothetical protein
MWPQAPQLLTSSATQLPLQKRGVALGQQTAFTGLAHTPAQGTPQKPQSVEVFMGVQVPPQQREYTPLGEVQCVPCGRAGLLHAPVDGSQTPAA